MSRKRRFLLTCLALIVPASGITVLALSWLIPQKFLPARAGNRAMLTISGQVQERYSMRIGPTLSSTGTDIPLAAIPDDGMELAKIVEFNNADGAYLVSVSSQNHGVLRNRGIEGLRYELVYNSERVRLGKGAAVLARGFREGGTRTTHVLKMRILPTTGRALASAIKHARYFDTLTFSIAAL